MAKPPSNPIIDAKVLARRQKDLEGYIDKYQAILDRRSILYTKDIYPFWQRAKRRIEEEIKLIYAELQDANGVEIIKQPIQADKYRNMQRQLERLARLHEQLIIIMSPEDQRTVLRNNLAFQYTEAYYFHAFSLEQSSRVAAAIPILTHDRVMSILNNPWLPDAKTYGDRIRANTAYLAKKMEESLEEAVTKGWSINRTARRIQEVADEGYYNAVRLARTELTRAAAIGSSHMYMQNADILDGKRWNATLDGRTAPKDADNDGKVYDLDYDTEVKPGKIGERIPNHPNCRCKYTPVLSALGISTRERIARDENEGRIYTKARTFREYAKERGLPDLDERLRNDNPRKYLRRGEVA